MGRVSEEEVSLWAFHMCAEARDPCFRMVLTGKYCVVLYVSRVLPGLCFSQSSAPVSGYLELPLKASALEDQDTGRSLPFLGRLLYGLLASWYSG